MKDIFVEVDWMKKEIEGRWYADGSVGKYYVPGFTIEYRMKEGAQNKVIRPFGKHDIALHIDDGCMGGGNSIIMTDELKYLSNDENDVLYNQNFRDKNPDRIGIFHWVIFCNKLEDEIVFGAHITHSTDGDADCK
ncbi:MAG: hypothetical protein DRN57_03490, partial [Thermoplasmata archaeon]